MTLHVEFDHTDDDIVGSIVLDGELDDDDDDDDQQNDNNNNNGSTQQRERKKQFRFSSAHDIVLLREANPGMPIDARRCRERTLLLLQHFERDGGGGDESTTRRDGATSQLNEAERLERNELCETVLEMRKVGEALRQEGGVLAFEQNQLPTHGTGKRASDASNSLPPNKRARPGAVASLPIASHVSPEMLLFLRNRQEQELKRDELDLRRKELKAKELRLELDREKLEQEREAQNARLELDKQRQDAEQAERNERFKFETEERRLLVELLRRTLGGR